MSICISYVNNYNKSGKESFHFEFHNPFILKIIVFNINFYLHKNYILSFQLTVELFLRLLMGWLDKMEYYKAQWPTTLVILGMAWLEVALESVKMMEHGLDLHPVRVCS